MKNKTIILIKKSTSLLVLVAVILIWQIIAVAGVIPNYMLPSPLNVIKAFLGDFTLLMQNTATTLNEALLGLFFGTIVGFIFACLMDRFTYVYKAIYPILVVTQTIPSIAIAPLLALWFGYGIAPKIILVAIVCFFPITVSLLNGFKSVNYNTIIIMRSMGANGLQIFRYIKLPQSIMSLFSGLRLSVSYAVVSAVISEWIGGFSGLGVYMIQVKKSYSYDKMFAVIVLISFISLILIYFVNLSFKIFKKFNGGNKEEV